MDFDLSNKVVIITGGAGLIGQEFATAVARSGGVPVIADIDPEKGGAACSSVKEKTRGQADFVTLDIASRDSLVGMIDVLSNKYGKIDCLVNNAYPRNKNYGRKFEFVEYADFCENVNKHLGGYFLAAQQMAVFFQRQGYGNIVNMSSIYGVIAPRFEIYDGTAMTTPVEYAVIKSAVIHLTKYMAKYFKGKNIRVNAISPGGIFDGQNESFKAKYEGYTLSNCMLNTSDVAGALLFLLSDASAHVNGQNIVIDDGFTL